ncbi:NUDIX domain-containing protein [Thermostilla marina]
MQRRGVVAVIRRDEQLLVIRRANGVAAPGKLCFPGGGMLPGESEPQTLIRELREELAVEITPLRRLWESMTPWNVHLTWWSAAMAVDSVPVPNPAEVAELFWMTVSELRTHPDLLESNLAFLDAVERGEFSLES